MRECDRQEKRVCEILGGKRQIGSGATPFLKGDGILEDLLIECKTRNVVSKSISVKKDWFDKARDEAFSMNKDGAIVVISFGDGKDYVCEELDSYVDRYKAHKSVLEIDKIICDRLSKKPCDEVVGVLNDIREVLR